MDINNEKRASFALLSIGSNIGDKRKNIETALDYLTISGAIDDIKVSSYYETEPVGFAGQDWFLNVAVSGYTNMQLYQLMQSCKSIEYLIGRILRKRWHSREIDIDILLYGNQQFKESKLTVPHPRMHERRFVLAPAAEIAGSRIHPGFGLSLNKLLELCNDSSQVKMAV